MGKFRLELRPVRRFAADVLSLARALDQTLAQRIYREEIGTHSFKHDLPVDVDHVTMADPIFVYHCGHLNARAEFAGQSLGGKD